MNILEILQGGINSNRSYLFIATEVSHTKMLTSVPKIETDFRRLWEFGSLHLELIWTLYGYCKVGFS